MKQTEDPYDPDFISGALVVGGVATGFTPTMDDLRKIWMSRTFSGGFHERYEFAYGFESFAQEVDLNKKLAERLREEHHAETKLSCTCGVLQRECTTFQFIQREDEDHRV
jgi:hypothetical protein